MTFHMCPVSILSAVAVLLWLTPGSAARAQDVMQLDLAFKDSALRGEGAKAFHDKAFHKEEERARRRPRHGMRCDVHRHRGRKAASGPARPPIADIRRQFVTAEAGRVCLTKRASADPISWGLSSCMKWMPGTVTSC
jgi:hypothetical protein